MCYLCLYVSVFVWSACVAQYLLPGDVRPRSYDLRLLYDVDPNTNFSYYGVVDILLTATEPVSKLVLHAQGFSIPEGGVTLKLNGPNAQIRGGGDTLSSPEAPIPEGGETLGGHEAPIPEGSETLSSYEAPIHEGGETLSGHEAPIHEGGETISGQEAPIHEGGETLSGHEASIYESGETLTGHEAAIHEGGETLSGHEAPIHEGGETLSGHEAPIYDGGETVSGHEVPISEGGETLSGHEAPIHEGGEILSGHEAPIQEGGETLSGHEAPIPEGGETLSGHKAPQVTSFHIDDTWNFLTLELSAALQKDNDYILTVAFYGNLKADLNGVYISHFFDKKSGQKQYLIATQFEPIAARKGFPCFDEPLYKATYQVNIGHHSAYTALSDMPVYESTNENLLEQYWPWTQVETTFKKDISQFVWDKFTKSVPMSTYLVAFVVVTNYNFIESNSRGLSHTTFRVWARRDAHCQLKYASTVGPKLLSHFEKFYNASFPLPKVDMIAIPDFSSNAMENWGLITYKENSLLYNDKESTFANKRWILMVIAHELAHQWFGNLVTMKWWNDLWLNEGFATFVASLGVAAVEPRWNEEHIDAVGNFLVIVASDSLETSHPVSVPGLMNIMDIISSFDEITYKKGSLLIRMMAMFLGDNVFLRALQNYIVKYSYSNAEQDDLWLELTVALKEFGGLRRHLSVKQVMDTWTTQTGYPLLTVTRDYTESTVALEQKRYHVDVDANAGNATWWIPLAVMSESEAGKAPDLIQWLTDEEGVGTKHRFEHSATTDEWIIFNYNIIAPFRVNYDSRNWQMLTATLASDNYKKVPELARVQLLSDAFALAWSEQLDYSIPLQLVNYLPRETRYLPIMASLDELSKIESMIKRSPDYGDFQKYMRQLIGNLYQKSGGLAAKCIRKPNDLNGVRIQILLSQTACRAQVPGCEENAIQLFQRWMQRKDPDTDNPIPLELRSTVYCTAMRRGSAREWRFMLERMQHANVANARDLAQVAITCSNEIWTLNQILEWCVAENSGIRQQESLIIVISITSSTVGYYVAKNFIYKRIADMHKVITNKLDSLIQTLISQFTTQHELDEYLSWQEKNTQYLKVGSKLIAKGIEKAKLNIKWINRHSKQFFDKIRELTV